MKIAFLTLGCKLNYAETSTYERGFLAAGFEVTQWRDSSADVYLINTCSVTTHAENKCRNIIRKCHRTSPEAAIVVTGCYAELRRAEVEALDGVRLVFGAGEKGRVVPDTLALLGAEMAGHVGHDVGSMLGHDDGNVMPGLTGHPAGSILPAYSSGERTRSFLKVQDGCDNFCAYCTVPFARGRSRNLPICELVRQAREIAAKGIKEIVLTGVNTGDFGRSTGESFLDLLKALNDVKGIERYRISSIEPNLLSEEIIDWIALGTKFLPHFHIPLQSGSDILLKSMGRKYDTALFASRIDYIRKTMGEHVFFGIDVIAGLPGETDEEFRKTYDFLKDRIRPAFIHIFPYSPRPGTRAAAMPGQVREGIKTERVSILEGLCNELSAAFRSSCAGLESKVLWEGKNSSGKMEGYSENYIRVDAPFDENKIGKIETVTL